jgi:hypothetical protein
VKVGRTDHKPVDAHGAVCFFVGDGLRQPPFHEVAVECFTAPPEGIVPVLQRRHIAGAYEFGLHGVQGPLQSSSSWLRPSWNRATNLTEADLTDAMGVTNEELQQQAASLEGATMPDGQKYEEWVESKGRR